MTDQAKSISLAYVVPTKDRPDDLAKLLASIGRQTVLPDQIVIVDAGDPRVEDLVAQFSALPITYVREFPPSLSRQRNAGMAALKDHIDVAGYMDDDIELAPDATEKIRNFWRTAGPQVGGAAFTIVNQPLRSPVLGLLSEFFLINSRRVGVVLPSGFSSSITPQRENIRTDWLYGGATLWRREVIARFAYDEWYIGHGYLEDLDFSYRVCQAYELWVVADARLWHWPHPIRLERNVDLGKQQMVNRVYFVRKMCHFQPLCVAWGLFGQSVRNGLESIRNGDKAGLLRLWGNILGLKDLVTQGPRPVEGIWK
jgi:glycosyltransferase involved in cell wall biosynthesis